MNYLISAYSIYLVLTIAITTWVTYTLYKNAGVFLFEIFKRVREVSDSVNNLLRIGFYLIAMGYALKSLKIELGVKRYDDLLHQYTDPIANLKIQDVFEILSYKIGSFVLIIGIVLFVILFIMAVLRGDAKHA